MTPIRVSDLSINKDSQFIQPEWWINFVSELAGELQGEKSPDFSIKYISLMRSYLSEYNATTFLPDEKHKSGRYVQFNDESDFLAFRLRYGK